MHGLLQDVLMQKRKVSSMQANCIGYSVVAVSTADEATPAWRNTVVSG
jgi:hypothetical protein